MSPREEWVFGDIDTIVATRKRAAAGKPPPPRRLSRPRRVIGRFVLFALWLACFLVGLGCLLTFGVGLLRDGTFTDAQIPIELSRRSAQRAQFRPWVPGKYVLSLMTDDREDHAEEETFKGRLYVRIESGDGRPQLTERFEPPALDHRLRGGVEFTPLADLYINTPALEQWTMTVRVGVEDPAFSNSRSAVLLRREKRIPGLSGLMNYVAAAPALLFLALSVPAALGLPRRGGTWMPALLSLSGLAAVAVLVLAA